MSFNALRDDIFSIIEAFSGPRQGPQDNVALIAQAQTQPAQPPAQEPLPFTPPTPVSSQVISGGGGANTLAGGDGGTDTLGGGGGQDTLQKPPQPLPTGGITSGPSNLPPLQPQAPGAPVPPPPAGGGLDLMKLWQMQQEKAEQAARMHTFISAGQQLAGALTRSPSAREALYASAAQEGQAASGRGSGGGGGLGGGLNFETLQKMKEEQDSLAASHYRQKVLIPELVKRYKADPVALQSLNAKDFSEVAAAYAKGDPLDIQVRKDGTHIITNKRTQEQFSGGAVDEMAVQEEARKRAEANRAAEAHPVELDLKKAQTVKTGLESGALKEEAAHRALVEKNFPELARLTGLDETYLRTMGPKLTPDFVKDRIRTFEPTGTQKTLAQHNAERAAMTPPQEPIGSEEYERLLHERELEKEKTKAGYGPTAQGAKEDLKLAGTANAAIKKGFIIRDQARGPLDRGEEGIIAGSGFADVTRKAQKTAELLTGGFYKGKRVGNTEVYAALMADETKTELEGLGAGTAISDNDVKFAKAAAAGDVELNQETMKRLLAIRDTINRRKAEENNAKVKRAARALGRPVDEDEILTLPPVGKEELRYMDAGHLRELVLDPERGKRVFEFYYGKEGAEAAANNIEQIIASKMQKQNENTKTYKDADTGTFEMLKGQTLKWFADPKNYASMKDAMSKQYGDMGDGLLDLIIAAKQADKFGVK